MAIPADLYKVELSGRWEVFDFPDPIVYFRWALTWWIESTVVTDDPVVLLQYAREFRAWFFAEGAMFQFLAHGTTLDRMACQRVLSGAQGVNEDDVVPPGAILAKPVVAQAALFVVGRSAVMGRQTRKWLPCVSESMLSFGAPIWPTDTAPNELTDWATESLRPKSVGPATLTPVLWNPDTETVSAITEILIAPMPRTIRRRALSEPFPLVKTWP